jgi:hypothetical protein
MSLPSSSEAYTALCPFWRGRLQVHCTGQNCRPSMRNTTVPPPRDTLAARNDVPSFRRPCESRDPYFIQQKNPRSAVRARVVHLAPPSERQRAQRRPGARCTRGLACKFRTRERTRAYRFSGNTPAFPAQWFYGLLRALPGDRAFLPPSLSRCPQELDTSVGVSGPHDFAVRLSHARQSLLSRPPHPAPTFVTMANAPLIEDGMAES